MNTREQKLAAAAVYRVLEKLAEKPQQSQAPVFSPKMQSMAPKPNPLDKVRRTGRDYNDAVSRDWQGVPWVGGAGPGDPYHPERLEREDDVYGSMRRDINARDTLRRKGWPGRAYSGQDAPSSAITEKYDRSTVPGAPPMFPLYKK